MEREARGWVQLSGQWSSHSHLRDETMETQDTIAQRRPPRCQCSACCHASLRQEGDVSRLHRGQHVEAPPRTCSPCLFSRLVLICILFAIIKLKFKETKLYSTFLSSVRHSGKLLNVSGGWGPQIVAHWPEVWRPRGIWSLEKDDPHLQGLAWLCS